MKLRVILLTTLLAAVLGWFAYEQQQGRTQDAEQWFLDFLLANGQETFAKAAPAESPDVVLVEFLEKDKAEYSAWPPAPLDFLMVLKRLVEHEPQVVAVVDPLRWEQAQTEFVTQLRNALVPFPSVVMGFHLASEGSDMNQEQSKFAADEMPVFPQAEGGRQGAPKFSRVTQIPDWSLRIVSQAGFSSISGITPPKDGVHFVADDGKRLVPSLAVQVITLFHHVPYVAQRLRFGTGARLSLGDQFVIPLGDDGTFALSDTQAVPSVNALELMTPDLGDDTSRAVQTMLGKGKVIVLGNGPRSSLHARAIASALAMPRIVRAPASVDWSFAAVAGLFCFWQLRCRRVKALATGLVALIAGLAICLLVFQSSLVWWPPSAALLLLATGTVFCFLWPAKKKPVAVAEVPPASAVPPA